MHVFGQYLVSTYVVSLTTTYTEKIGKRSMGSLRCDCDFGQEQRQIDFIFFFIWTYCIDDEHMIELFTLVKQLRKWLQHFC